MKYSIIYYRYYVLGGMLAQAASSDSRGQYARPGSSSSGQAVPRFLFGAMAALDAPPTWTLREEWRCKWFNRSPDSRRCALARRWQAVVTARLTSQAVVTARLVLQGFLHALRMPMDQPHTRVGICLGWVGRYNFDLIRCKLIPHFPVFIHNDCCYQSFWSQLDFSSDPELPTFHFMFSGRSRSCHCTIKIPRILTF